MEQKEKKAAPVKRSGYPWEDRALKAAAQFMGEELLPLLGVKGNIKRIAPTEQIQLKTEDFSEDFNYEMTDGRILHLEFESDTITKDDLRRFRVYEAIISYQYKREVFTCVVCTSKTKRLQKELKEGINNYRVKIIQLKKWNADLFICDLEKKQEREGLNREDMLKLTLSPLMGGKLSQPERIRRSFRLLRQEQERQENMDLNKMQAVLYALAEKFLEKEELEKIKEEIHMTRIGQMIYEDGIEKGMEEGMEKGMEKTNRLIICLSEQNRMEDILKAAKDSDYQKKLFTEFNL